jgi:hypothetical protein
MREKPDAVDSEEHTSGGKQGEDERSRLMMLAQMESDDHEGQQKRSCQEWLQITVV